jgi:hypothetical protein
LLSLSCSPAVDPLEGLRSLPMAVRGLRIPAQGVVLPVCPGLLVVVRPCRVRVEGTCPRFLQ